MAHRFVNGTDKVALNLLPDTDIVIRNRKWFEQ